MQAISEWQTIAGQEPGNVDAHLALARAYLKVGDRARALGEYDRVLALAPGQVEAREFVVKGKARP
jgi:cytochrome c-type biogenesis protein CcmH/NrfG